MGYCKVGHSPTSAKIFDILLVEVYGIISSLPNCFQRISDYVHSLLLCVKRTLSVVSIAMEAAQNAQQELMKAFQKVDGEYTTSSAET